MPSQVYGLCSVGLWGARRASGPGHLCIFARLSPGGGGSVCIHLTQPASAPSRSSPSPPPCPLLRRGSGQPDDQSGSPTMGVCRSRAASWILPRRDRPPCLSPTLGPHDEDTACCERTRRRRAASWYRRLGVKITGLDAQKTARRERGCRGRRHCCTQSPQRDASQTRLSAWPPGRRRRPPCCHHP